MPVSRGAIGPDETTSRVSGWVISPWSGCVACQPGGSATVTPPVPARGGAATASATPAIAYNFGQCPPSISPG